MLGDIIPLDILSSIWSQCNSCDGDCSAGGITLFSVAIHECWVKLWSLHRVRASLTTVVLSQMQSPYMKRLCTACYRWYTLRTNNAAYVWFFGFILVCLAFYQTPKRCGNRRTLCLCGILIRSNLRETSKMSHDSLQHGCIIFYSDVYESTFAPQWIE